ncbi:FMN-binding negative transcriptional regulator [Mesorhizobium amorphae]|uniref:Transcriptional regulator n=1 Tax=Mesorhizobium amorphae CCNWGS0123 TaxID=1082933 RepID=G6YJ48_9HYPH|nr:FMN-binding negative transcriptional regulator [Mesorhizobium amorphae]ANT54721.1 transcriptional regulator [Mesorhizobium amorphae CCNWGS0123]EHH05476.1 transcriptional regulator [Mesorhizobium amorphae CCNWGS0123]
MYLPSHFIESRLEVLHDLIERNPLGILFTNSKGEMDANHIPFLLDTKQGTLGVLHCHVARANPVWQNAANGDEVLVVFRAADAYITPTWYPTKHETQRQVPTWNYMVAHAYGQIRIRDDERYVRAIVARLTRIHEATRETPWKMTHAPRDYIDALVKAIVGIEIEVTRLTGKSKLGQDDGAPDMRGAGLGLKAQGDILIGDAMIARADIDVQS